MEECWDGTLYWSFDNWKVGLERNWKNLSSGLAEPFVKWRYVITNDAHPKPHLAALGNDLRLNRSEIIRIITWREVANEGRAVCESESCAHDERPSSGIDRAGGDEGSYGSLVLP